MPDAREALRRLYRSVDGFEISKTEEKAVSVRGGSPTYGEIMPTAMLQLFEVLDLRQKDVFADLGAGVGKVVLGAALATRARKCIGVELANRRLHTARKVLRQAEAERLVAPGRCELRHEDLLTSDLSDATVLYACSTAFAAPFMHRLMNRVAELDRARVFISTQALDEHPKFRLADILRLDMSWRRRSKVYIYRIS